MYVIQFDRSSFFQSLEIELFKEEIVIITSFLSVEHDSNDSSEIATSKTSFSILVLVHNVKLEIVVVAVDLMLRRRMHMELKWLEFRFAPIKEGNIQLTVCEAHQLSMLFLVESHFPSEVVLIAVKLEARYVGINSILCDDVDWTLLWILILAIPVPRITLGIDFAPIRSHGLIVE